MLWIDKTNSHPQKISFNSFSNTRTYISPPFWIVGPDALPSTFCVRFPDHVNGHCTSPTSQSCSSGKRLSSADISKANRRGPGRPPFRKAQSAACMEISLPVTTEGGWQLLLCWLSVNFSPGVKVNLAWSLSKSLPRTAAFIWLFRIRTTPVCYCCY